MPQIKLSQNNKSQSVRIKLPNFKYNSFSYLKKKQESGLIYLYITLTVASLYILYTLMKLPFSAFNFYDEVTMQLKMVNILVVIFLLSMSVASIFNILLELVGQLVFKTPMLRLLEFFNFIAVFMILYLHVLNGLSLKLSLLIFILIWGILIYGFIQKKNRFSRFAKTKVAK